MKVQSLPERAHGINFQILTKSQRTVKPFFGLAPIVGIAQPCPSSGCLTRIDYNVGNVRMLRSKLKKSFYWIPTNQHESTQLQKSKRFVSLKENWHSLDEARGQLTK